MPTKLVVRTDANWIGQDSEDQKCLSCVVVRFGEHVIDVVCSKRDVVSLRAPESEFNASRCSWRGSSRLVAVLMHSGSCHCSVRCSPLAPPSSPTGPAAAQIAPERLLPQSPIDRSCDVWHSQQRVDELPTHGCSAGRLGSVATNDGDPSTSRTRNRVIPEPGHRYREHH